MIQVMFQIVEAASRKSPHIRVLKIGKNFAHPQRIRARTKIEKFAVKAVRTFNKRCVHLTSLDLRDMVRATVKTS
jgi:hypothetical protein